MVCPSHTKLFPIVKILTNEFSATGEYVLFEVLLYVVYWWSHGCHCYWTFKFTQVTKLSSSSTNLCILVHLKALKMFYVRLICWEEQECANSILHEIYLSIQNASLITHSLAPRDIFTAQFRDQLVTHQKKIKLVLTSIMLSPV